MANPYLYYINNPLINSKNIRVAYTAYNPKKNEEEDTFIYDWAREALENPYQPTVQQTPTEETQSVETPEEETPQQPAGQQTATGQTPPVQEDVTDEIFGKFGNSISHFEGSRLNAYRDAHGYAIGRGHFLGTDPSYANYKITQEQADKYFEEDSKNIRKVLNDLLSKNPNKAKSIDDVRYNILFDLGYNGGTGLLTKLFNDWDGSEESMESLLGRYATTSKATAYAQKMKEEETLRKRAAARVASWKKTANNKNQNWRTTMVVKQGGKIGTYQRQFDLSFNPFEE